MPTRQASDEGVPREKHLRHHAFIEEWLEQWKRIRWSVITTVVTSAVLSVFGLMWWAFVVFVQRGGQ